MEESPGMALTFACKNDLKPRDLAKELYLAYKENQMRGLVDNQVFLSELLSCLDGPLDDVSWQPPFSHVDLTHIVQSLIALEEWERAAHYSKKLDSALLASLHFWARLQRAELDIRILQANLNNLPVSVVFEARKTFAKLLRDLESYPNCHDDPYLNFFRARILLNMKKDLDARDALLKSLNQQPCNWLGWTMLRKFVDCKDTLITVRLLDPYRLQQMDVFSNLLYVQGYETELTYLAHFCLGVKKYCRETCAVIANFLSLRGQHDRAVEYYRRALKLDPSYSQGWTLLGHECVEIKDTTSAIEAYRQATAINERDYHAWYGLGQLFEVLKMPYFALRYHQRAHALRPTDSRILVAMADCYRKLGATGDAKKAYYKAYQTGDIEGMVLHQLGGLHAELGERQLARECYSKFLEECDERLRADVEEQGDAFLYLAQACLEDGQLDEALVFSQKGFNYANRREESKMIIRQIAAVREVAAVSAANYGSSRNNTDGCDGSSDKPAAPPIGILKSDTMKSSGSVSMTDGGSDPSCNISTGGR